MSISLAITVARAEAPNKKEARTIVRAEKGEYLDSGQQFIIDISEKVRLSDTYTTRALLLESVAATAFQESDHCSIQRLSHIFYKHDRVGIRILTSSYLEPNWKAVSLAKPAKATLSSITWLEGIVYNFNSGQA